SLVAVPVPVLVMIVPVPKPPSCDELLELDDSLSELVVPEVGEELEMFICMPMSGQGSHILVSRLTHSHPFIGSSGRVGS
ncbi:MAG: hypothetical protein V1744_02165, partial [Candidatus Altiarchaeota archaeon]